MTVTAPAPDTRGDDAASKRQSGRARRWRDLVRRPNSPSRAEAARLEVDVARSARNAARFADRDRRYRLFGFSILAAVYFSCRARHASRAPDRARRAPLTSSRALRPSPCSGDTVERRGRARGGRRHPRGAQDRAVPDREWCSTLFGFSTLVTPTLFSPPRDTRRFATAATDARGVSDARHGRGARLDTRTHRPALKTRASRSASLNPAVTPRGLRSRILLEHGGRGTNRSNRQSGSNFARCVFAALPAPLRGDDAASKRPFGRARRLCDLV